MDDSWAANYNCLDKDRKYQVQRKGGTGARVERSRSKEYAEHKYFHQTYEEAEKTAKVLYEITTNDGRYSLCGK